MMTRGMRRLPSRGLIRATVMMFTVRLALWVVPFSRLRSYLERRRDARMRRGPTAGRGDPASIARHVALASRVVPRSTCLVRALVAEQLLADAGHESVLRFGIAHTTGPAFSAHAWIEYDGQVLIGGDTSPFTAFVPVERGRES